MNQNSQNFLKIRLDFHLMISYHSACAFSGNRAEIIDPEIIRSRLIKPTITLRRISIRRHLQPAGDLFLSLILRKYPNYDKKGYNTVRSPSLALSGYAPGGNGA
jgi:hypothetical protein